MQEILNLEIYKFCFLFLRLGSAFVFMPGFMSSYISARIRLCLALGITFILAPVLSNELGTPPSNDLTLIQIIFYEITIGVFLSLIMQTIFAALNLAGNLAGQSIGFANAQMFDPSFNTQSIILETFLSFLALTVIFITNLHHLMLEAIVDSYKIFPIGNGLPWGDFSKNFSEMVNSSFIMGFKLSSPFIAFTIIFYVGMGLVSRLMPQLNIFFLSLPLQLYLGISLLMLTTPVIIMWFSKYFEDSLVQYLR